MPDIEIEVQNNDVEIGELYEEGRSITFSSTKN